MASRLRVMVSRLLVGAMALTAEAVEYTYTDPVWYVEATSATNEIAAAKFTKVVGGVESASSWDDFSAATTGTLVKRGANCVRIERSLETFTGEFHVEEGVLYIKHFRGLGDWLGGNVFAHDGASIVMHHSKDDPEVPYTTPYDKYITKRFKLDGKGAAKEPGKMILKDDETSGQRRWFSLRGIDLSSDATIYVDCKTGFANWRPTVTYNLNGHVLTYIGGNSVAAPTFVNNGIYHKNGTIVVSNMTYGLQSYLGSFEGCSTNELILGKDVVLQALGGGYNPSAWKMIFAEGFKRWHFNYENVAFDPDGNYNHWRGPVQLDTMVKMYNNNSTSKHQTGYIFDGPISGVGGFTHEKGVTTRYMTDMSLVLNCPTNTFQGGVELNKGILYLGANGAMPKDGGDIVLSNDSVLNLRTADKYDLPKLVATGNVSVVSANDLVRGDFTAIEKAGSGILDYDVYRIGATNLEIAAGTFKLPASRISAVAGLYGGVITNKNTTAAISYLRGSTTITNEVTLRAEGAYHKGDYYWTSTCAFTYEGYIWNTNTTDVTWTFAANIDGGYRLLIDNKEVLPYTGYRWCPSCTNVTLTPGPHPIEIRMCGGGGGEYGGTYRVHDPEGKGRSPYTTQQWVWVDRKGFMYDPLARCSTNVNDYIIPVDDGSGSLFTVETNKSVLVEYLPKFGTMKFAAGTTFDMSEQTYLAGAFEGLPTVTNCVSLSLTNDWTVSLADVAANAKMTVDGKLKFGANSRLVLKDEQKLSGDYTLVTAAEEIEGMPTLVEPTEVHRTYGLKKSDDGKSLILNVCSPGIVIIVN